MRQGETEGVKGRGQTAAEEATQRRTGEEKISEWEISPTLEDRSDLSGRIRGGKLEGEEERKDGKREEWKGKRKESKQGADDGKEGKISSAHVITQLMLGQLPSFLVAESSRNSFDYKCLIEKHGFS